MKILRVTSFGYEAGGSDNGIILLQPVLKEMGHTVKILSSDAGPHEGRFNDYTFVSLDRQSPLLKLFYRSFYPHSFFALRRALKEFKPDIVQLHTMFEVSPSVLFALRDYPTVVTIHGAEDFTPSLLLWAFPTRFFKGGGFACADLNVVGWLHYLYHTYINGIIYKVGFRYVQKFIVFSAYMQRLLKEDGIETVLIPNATRLFDYVPINPASRTIAYVGRLEKIKGVQDVIEALTKIRRTFPDAMLKIAGAGTYRKELELLVTKRNLTHAVVFLGHQKREELYELYKESAVVVVPSVWPEPFGKVGIEAMSVGRPVIASNVGGISEWLTDGETGYLIPPEDPKAIAEKILTLFGSNSLLESMSKRAVERAKDFSIEEHAAKMLLLYENVIKNYAAR